MTSGQIVKLEITGSGSDGEGVGRHDGMTVFVRGAYPGDTVSAKLTTVKKRFAKATLREIISPSPDRVKPICGKHDVCGGCPFAGLSYEAGLEIKRQTVQNALTRLGGFSDFELEPITPMDPPIFPCRNKASFGISRGIVGFRSRGSHDIVDISGCPVIHPANSQIIEDIRGMRIKDLQGIVTRISSFSNERQITLRRGPLDDIREEVIEGAPHITESVNGIRLMLSPGSFFQVNTSMAEKMYSAIPELSGLSGSETVVDAYCGVGGIALSVAAAAKRVIGLECEEAAVSDAKSNAELNGIANAEFELGKAEELLAGLESKIDVVIADPPRRGLDQGFIDAVCESGAARFVYVSCDPATLARDARLFAERGFRLMRARAFDMFPFTAEVETVAVLERE